ncbi:MAG TPA: hypothetical protein VGO50_01430 [Pyrinomonadaceae bacterium]|jgi:hypothetical protein|nr:hypothetical protein [Pyrinomonadaceae bacterium]
MDRNKIILLIVLVLIVAAYIFFVVWGATSDDNKADPAHPQKTPVDGKNYSPDPSTKQFGNIMGDWLGGYLPKSGIPCSIPAAKDSGLTCEAISIGETRIGVKKGTTFRMATLVWKKGEADVKYDDEADKTSDEEMDDHQNFVLSNSGANKTVKKNTIIIFEEGGKLTISCLNNASCQVGLK